MSNMFKGDPSVEITQKGRRFLCIKTENCLIYRRSYDNLQTENLLLIGEIFL